MGTVVGELWVVDLATQDHGVWMRLDPCLAPYERERSTRFRREQDRISFVVGRTAARRLLAKHLRVEAAEVPLTTRCTHCGGDHGAPRLPDELKTFVSISHSGHLIAVAVACLPIGIDVEKKADRPPAPIAPIALSPQELACGIANDQDEFYRVWVSKEAYAKGIGLGLRQRFDELTIRPAAANGAFRVVRRETDDLEWWIQLMDLGPMCCGAVALRSHWPIELRDWHVDGILSPPYPSHCWLVGSQWG